jgi:predicted N-acetyltransferase YhbS
VTAGFAGIERYDATRHDVTSFGCGNELLDRWLLRYARQNQRQELSTDFVAANDDGHVYDYYTLLAGQLDHRDATTETSKGLSQYFPIPVAILARLAVEVMRQNRGIGAALLNV